MVTQTVEGAYQFRIFVPGAARVELMATFTGWHDGPIEMARSVDGWFEVELELEPGDHEFQYLLDGRSWLADYAAGGVRLNRFGTWVSLLHVPATTAVLADEDAMPTIETRPTLARGVQVMKTAA